MMSLKNKFFIASLFTYTLFLHSVALAKIEVVLGPLPLEYNPNLSISAPQSNESEIVLSREQYVISYNKEKRIPNWVAWKLEQDQMGSSGRTNNFKQDPDLDGYLKIHSPGAPKAVDQTEYKGSCFDRGHQIPSADRTDLRENNQTTFYMSNMIPQTPFMNRVIWAHLEQYTRDLVQKQGKKVYVISGPIYDQDFGSIGPKADIKVPSKQFKILFIQGPNQQNETLAVIMPNTLKNGENPGVNKAELCKPLAAGTNEPNDWMKYKTTIEEIEKISGLKIISSGDHLNK